LKETTRNSHEDVPICFDLIAYFVVVRNRIVWWRVASQKSAGLRPVPATRSFRIVHSFLFLYVNKHHAKGWWSNGATGVHLVKILSCKNLDSLVSGVFYWEMSRNYLSLCFLLAVGGRWVVWNRISPKTSSVAFRFFSIYPVLSI
jgi:hypothetical protein